MKQKSKDSATVKLWTKRFKVVILPMACLKSFSQPNKLRKNRKPIKRSNKKQNHKELI